MEEEWKPLFGHPNYEGSTKGRIRNASTRQTLTPWLRAGYPTVNLRDGKTRKLRSVHTAIAETFVGPRPTPGRYHCAHLDGDRTNSRPTNLAWVTPTENERQKRAHGTYDRGQWSKVRKFTPEQVSIIRSIIQAGTTRSDLALLLGVTVSTVANIASGKFYSG